MRNCGVRHTGRVRTPETNAERLTTFTDGVAAIAITLLVLPLVDLVPESQAKGQSLGDLLHDHQSEIIAFVVSFAVIARLWWAHHQLFRHVAFLSSRLVLESLVWTFTIVVLPLPTAVITAYDTSPATLCLYIGTLIVSSAALTSASIDLRSHPELSGDRTPMGRSGVLGISLTLVSFVLALALSLLLPGLGFWSLLLASFTGLVQAPIERRWPREDGATASQDGPTLSKAGPAPSGDGDPSEEPRPRS
jgi:uncharacterized membrane protein